MINKGYSFIEYMCKYCGTKQTKPKNMGKPMPGECPRRNKDASGKRMGHSWIINRKK